MSEAAGRWPRTTPSTIRQNGTPKLSVQDETFSTGMGMMLAAGTDATTSYRAANFSTSVR